MWAIHRLRVMMYFFQPVLLFVWVFILQFGCTNSPIDGEFVTPRHKYFPPQYDLVQLESTTDSIKFYLDDSTFNNAESFNYFSKDGNDYISFFDERSLAMNIYHFQSRKKVRLIPIIKSLKGHKMSKTTAFMLSPDTIVVHNNKTFYLLNGSGTVQTRINFLKNPPLAWALVDNGIPPILKDGRLYTAVRSNMDDESLSALKTWKIIYEFDLRTMKATLRYSLPEFLQKNYYGRRFLDNSYCYNNRGYFVFSFSGDSAIYETNFQDYHIAYSGKSRYQESMISPMSRIEVDEQGRKNYMLGDSYGSIYFDHVRKRYLRVAHCGVSLQDYEAKKKKNQRVIIFDENLKIIGESLVDNKVSLKSLFFTNSGEIYARILAKDENALHFLRLSYREMNSNEIKIAKNEN